MPTPVVADALAPLEDYERPLPSLQVVSGGKTSLTASDDDGLDAFERSRRAHGDPPSLRPGIRRQSARCHGLLSIGSSRSTNPMPSVMRMLSPATSYDIG